MSRFDIYRIEDDSSIPALTTHAAIAAEIGAWWDQQSFELSAYVAIPKDGRKGFLAQFDLPANAEHIVMLSVPGGQLDFWTNCLKPIGEWISSCSTWETSDGGVDELLERVKTLRSLRLDQDIPAIEHLYKSIDRYRLQNLIYDYRSVLEACFEIVYDEDSDDLE
jgi:hypothetical protein